MDTTSKWFDYLHNTRGLTPEVISEAQLSEELGRLKIPVFDEAGNELFAKLRRPHDSEIGPKYLYQAGGRASLYGVNFKDLHTDNLLTEGELDCLAVRSAGLNAFTSTGGALTFRKEWLELLPENRRNIICFDNDETGIKGAVKVAIMMQQGFYTWVPPVFGKDASDLVMAVGLTKAREMLIDPSRVVNFDLRATNQAQEKAVMKKLSDDIKAIDNSVGKKFLIQLAFDYRMTHKETKPKKRHENVDNAIQQARNYPIENLMPFAQRKHICLWHQENTASLHLYKDNSLFCHGACARQFDAIDVYMKLHQVGFMEAVKALSHLE